MPEKTTQNTHLKLTLVENGIDFVRAGIERYFLRDTPSPRDHKYAVLHGFAGVLLLLKARLAREHPSLIFTKVEEVGNSDASTVNFKQVIERLDTIAKIDLKPYIATLQSAQRTRNRLEHYEVHLELAEAQELVGRLCEFVYLFLRDELQENLQDHLKGLVWERVQELRGIAEELDKKRKAEWEKRALRYRKVTKKRLEKLWADSISGSSNGMSVPPLACPECGQDRVVVVEPQVALCTNAGCTEVFLAGHCLRCETTVLHEEEGFCEDCVAYIDRD